MGTTTLYCSPCPTTKQLDKFPSSPNLKLGVKLALAILSCSVVQSCGLWLDQHSFAGSSLPWYFDPHMETAYINTLDQVYTLLESISLTAQLDFRRKLITRISDV